MKNAVETASLETFKTFLNGNHIFFEQGFRQEVPTVPFNLNCPGILSTLGVLVFLH